MTIWRRIKWWLDSTITTTFGPPSVGSTMESLFDELGEKNEVYSRALAAADVAFKKSTEKTNERLVAYREFKPCPSCRGTDILAGYSIKRGVEEVWCDECGYTVFADDPWRAVAEWNAQPRNPETD